MSHTSRPATSPPWVTRALERTAVLAYGEYTVTLTAEEIHLVALGLAEIAHIQVVEKILAQLGTAVTAADAADVADARR